MRWRNFPACTRVEASTRGSYSAGFPNTSIPTVYSLSSLARLARLSSARKRKRRRELSELRKHSAASTRSTCAFASATPTPPVIEVILALPGPEPGVNRLISVTLLGTDGRHFIMGHKTHERNHSQDGHWFTGGGRKDPGREAGTMFPGPAPSGAQGRGLPVVRLLGLVRISRAERGSPIPPV